MIENKHIEQSAIEVALMPPTPPATETPFVPDPTPSMNVQMPPTPPATQGEEQKPKEEIQQTVEWEEEPTEWHGETETTDRSTPEPTETIPSPTPTPTFEQDYVLLDAIQNYLQDYLHQAYFVDSILKISTKIVENERAVKEAFYKADSFIDGDAWVDCARDAIKAFQPFNKAAFGDKDTYN